MKRLFSITAVLVLIFVAVSLHSRIKDFFWAHPWWHSTFVAIPALLLAFLEWKHDGEANDLRRENNRLRSELDTERNQHLGQIAENTKKPVSQAERNASILRKNLRNKVAISEGNGHWGAVIPEIVEVSDDDIVTLFTPHSYHSPNAYFIRVRCGDLEITETPRDASTLRLRILKRYGDVVQLGEITKWEDRCEPTATPTFTKGGTPYYATYSKPGTGDRRSLYVYQSADGTNSFLLETSTGENTIGDNKEISKKFAFLQIEYQADGFRRSSSGSGGSNYPLFIC